jgi:ABC-type transport system involved in cytochrome c biogenesis permease subunit
LSEAAAHRLSFTTALPPEECRRRLAERCAGFGELLASAFTRSIDPARPLHGRVTPGGFGLFRFGMTLATKLFMVAWLGGVGAGAVVAVWVSRLRDPWAVLPVGMFVFGIGLVMFGRWLARNEEARLREMLAGVLEARGVIPAWRPIE